jgi:D-alanine--poly(phosphoribitol) ligase subunit 2
LLNESAIVERLRALFLECLHIDVPSADADLFETGMLDSLQLVELLLQLEQQFGFRIKIDNIDLDDLRTLARIARLLAAHVGTPEASPRQSLGRLSERGVSAAKG